VNGRWQSEMRDFFEGGEDADKQMRPLAEIFHLP
jgi:L-rhamnose mutarotase